MEYYTHLINDERVRISLVKQEGFNIRQMARQLDRSPSAISRELRRNQAPPGHYWPDTAEQLSKSRHRRGCKLNHFKALSSFVIRIHRGKKDVLKIRMDGSERTFRENLIYTN